MKSTNRIGLLLLSLGLVAACQKEPVPRNVEATPAAPASNTEAAAKAVAERNQLVRIADRSQVCMVNDQFMGRAQIPVDVEGRTYFGCCEMCKGRLERDAAVRSALDPLSKRPVDKASAVIARAENGSVLYFESESNLVAYAERAR